MGAGAYVPTTPSGFEIPNATSATDGAMSKEDKAKLDASGGSVTAPAPSSTVGGTTPTADVFSIALAENENLYSFNLTVHGVRTDTSSNDGDWVLFSGQVGVGRIGSAAPTIYVGGISPFLSIYETGDAARTGGAGTIGGATASYVIVGNSLVVRVQGVSGATIRWSCTVGNMTKFVAAP